MNDLILESNTRQLINRFCTRPSHALAVIAPEGMGKGTIARLVAATLLEVPVEKVNEHSYFSAVMPVNNSISIDEVRRVQRALQLKTIGAEKEIRRLILIEQAHLLTLEAQNAVLKILEEPPVDTVIILTTTNLQRLVSTITSRVQPLIIKKPSLQDVLQFYKQSYSAVQIERVFHLGDGLPGLMSVLLSQDQEHPLIQAIETVKQWLSKPLFERLKLVDELTKQKADIKVILFALQRVSQAALQQSAEQRQTKALYRWKHILHITINTQEAFEKNAQTKLVLTNLMLQL